METIKFITRGKNKGKIKLGEVLYTGFPVGKLPNKFAFIWDEDNETDGYTEWFNLNGLTYISIPDSPFN